MNFRKLIKDLRHKLRRDQDNLALRLELADLYRHDGNDAEALQAYREVAIAFWRAGRLDEAELACNRAIDLAPHDLELAALLSDITTAQRANRGTASSREPVPQRRAQVWQTPSMPAASVEPGPTPPPAAPAQAPAPARTERPSLLTDPPTPLPAPLALHDLPEDSLMAQQPARLRDSHSGSMPRILLPSGLTDHDDDVLALAGPSPQASSSRERTRDRESSMADIEILVVAEPPPDDDDLDELVEDLGKELPDDVSGTLAGDLDAGSRELDDDALASGIAGALGDDDDDDDDDDEEDTDVRLQLARAVPQEDDGRASEDLTAPVMRLTYDSRRERTPARPDDRPGVVSGEISIDDEPGDGRDTHPTLAGDDPASAGDEQAAEDQGDELTWIKELPVPPGAPLTPPTLEVQLAMGQALARGAPPASPPAKPAKPRPAEPADQTVPVELAPAGGDTGSTMVAEAVDEDKILAEEAVEQPRPRRRSAPRTIMDMAPPVPSAAASVGARKAALSSVFGSFPEHVIEDLAEQVALRSFADAEYVLREGEPGRACFVVASGAVRVLRRDPVGESHELVEVARLARGALFGERALLADRNRQGAVQAHGACSLYEIPRRVLRELVVVHHALGPLLEVFYREHLVRTLLESVPFLQALPRTWRESLSARFRPVRRASGETILRQGERSGGLYLVVLGAVEITQRPSVRRARLLATLGEGMYFGDMSRLDQHGVVGATVSAAGPVELAVLPADEFDAVVAERPGLWAELCERGQRRELERSNLLTGETALL